MNTQYICVYDYETVAVKGKKATDANIAEPIQVAAAIIHPRRLEFVKDAEFKSYICPPIDRDDVCPEVIAWHAKNAKCTSEEILDKIYSAPAQKTVWENFMDFMKQYHVGTGNKCIFTAPVFAGMNIKSYDNKITERLCHRYGNIDKNGEVNITRMNISIDLLDVQWLFFENNPEIKSLSMDNMRKYYGIDTEGGHNALKDVYDTGNILIRYLKFCRAIASKTNFKGAFAKGHNE